MASLDVDGGATSPLNRITIHGDQSTIGRGPEIALPRVRGAIRGCDRKKTITVKRHIKRIATLGGWAVGIVDINICLLLKRRPYDKEITERDAKSRESDQC